LSTSKGKKAEDAAAGYLIKHGYSILDRNRRLGRGELDIVASKGDILAFVEVKGHQHRDASLLAMHTGKCQRMISAAQAWLGLHESYANLQCRFDLVIVTPRQPAILPATVEHMQDVLRL